VKITFRILTVLSLLLATACTPETTADDPEQTVEVVREIELTARARIPENDSNFQSVEVFADRLVFHYSGTPEQSLEPIDLGTYGTYAPVVAGSRGGGYLREITSIREVSPNVFEAQTGPAYLTDLIASGHFRVHHNPSASSYTDGENVAARAELEGGVTLLPIGLGEACEASSGGSVEVDPTLDLDVDFDIDINIDVDVDWGWTGPSISGRLVSADFVMSGSLELGAEVTASTNGSVSCEVDLIDFARDRGINVPSREWTTTFAVGVVPVVLTHEVGPTASISVEGSVETGTATATGSVTYSIRAGTEYREATGWREVWEPRRASSGSFEVGMPGTVTIEAGLSAGVEYECKIYDLLGPKIGLEGSLTGTFSSDLCEWEGEVSAGISITGGGSIDIPVIDQTLVEFSFSQELASATLWERDGTWPWCEDGGGPDAGTDAAVDDPCMEANECGACNELAGCGFCGASGTCMNDSRMGECGGQWADAVFECTDCSAPTSCGPCVTEANCGWCGGTGACMTAEAGGAAPPECGSGWYFNVADFCPGGP
jgi:hypothetical protein